MIVSHSRVECFEKCPYQYDLRYNQSIRTIPPDNADNALFLGTALHTGLEKNVEAAIHEYFMSYPCITDAHVNEAMKLEAMIPKAKAMIPDGINELKIEDEDFVGFIDLLAPARTEQKLGGQHQIIPNVYDLYDFKYSNNVSHYKESPQLHLYKYFFEKNNPGKVIRRMFFLVVPKVNIKQSKKEDLFQFRKRIQEELDKAEPKLVEIEYDPEKVINFLLSTKTMLEAQEFPKCKSWLCNYCEYNEFCQKGNDFMNLPSSERRNITETTKRKIWIYGAAFSGKTTMLDDAPNPLNLTTDGNIQFVTMPYMAIKDEVTVNGRMTNRKFAWEVFKDTIAELEKKQNDFRTIIIDLLEDTREMCRIYMYDSLGIQHESDSGFGKGWDIIKTEYLSTMRRFFNLDYENLIVVSHEDISKDITKKNGQNITRIVLVGVIVCSLFLYLDRRKNWSRYGDEEQLQQLYECLQEFRKGKFQTYPEETSESEQWLKVWESVKELGQYFEDLKERLEQEENGTKSLITDISHQLKTPLASLRMSHELVA